MEIFEKLKTIQQTLKAPKDQYNSFGGYNYRSCESILEAVKPALAATKTVLLISDAVEAIGGRVYVKAVATLVDIDNPSESVVVTAYAREDEAKKGMDSSQITGATSSYARKYALNGLFCIDDNKDSDATNTHGKATAEAPSQAKGPAAHKTGDYVPTCVGCGATITVAEHDYSAKRFGKPLCRACQRKESANA